MALFFFQLATAMAEPLVSGGGIDISNRDGLLVVRPYVQAEGELEYRLESSKTGVSGSTTGSQSGIVQAHAGEKTFLSELKLSFQDTDHVSFILSIFDDTQLIKRFQIQYPRIGGSKQD